VNLFKGHVLWIVRMVRAISLPLPPEQNHWPQGLVGDTVRAYLHVAKRTGRSEAWACVSKERSVA